MSRSGATDQVSQTARPEAYKDMNLTLRSDQAQVLATISDHGPIPPSEVARHLLVDDDWARSRLRTLERRNLVAANYTASGFRARAYEITTKGSAALVMCGFEEADDA